MFLYGVPFLKALVAALFFSVFLFAGAKKNGRKVFSRLGGAAIIAGFSIVVLTDFNLIISREIAIILVGSAAVLFFGLADDFFDLSWKWQLFFQFILAVAIIAVGLRIEYVSNLFGEGIIFLNTGWLFWLGIILSGVWIIFVINAVNWLDGIDGLSGGVAVFSGLVIFLLSLKPEVNQPPAGILAMAFSGAVAGFLLVNLSVSKFIAGTAGAFFMGFFLAAIAVFAGMKVATTLMVLFLPLFDCLWVIGERIGAGKSVFVGNDKKHLHYKLQIIGWSEKKILFFAYAFTVLMGLTALLAERETKLFIMAAALVGLIFFYADMDKKLRLKKI